MKDPIINLHLSFRPEHAAITQDTMQFLTHYSNQFYPAASQKIIHSFRSCIRKILSDKDAAASKHPSYAMMHYTQHMEGSERFSITESLNFQGLLMEVVASNPTERATILEHVKDQAKREDLMRARDLPVFLNDEMRMHQELWGNTFACDGLPAVDFFNHLNNFFATAGGKCFVHKYELNKGEEIRLAVELLMPKVSAYYIRIECAFK